MLLYITKEDVITFIYFLLMVAIKTINLKTDTQVVVA